MSVVSRDVTCVLSLIRSFLRHSISSWFAFLFAFASHVRFLFLVIDWFAKRSRLKHRERCIKSAELYELTTRRLNPLQTSQPHTLLTQMEKLPEPKTNAAKSTDTTIRKYVKQRFWSTLLSRVSNDCFVSRSSEGFQKASSSVSGTTKPSSRRYSKYCPLPYPSISDLISVQT